MEPFTNMVVLRAFSRRADGDFSYLWLWHTVRFTERMYYDVTTHDRKWACESVTKV